MKSWWQKYIWIHQNVVYLDCCQGEDRPAFKHMFKVKHFLGFKHDHYVWFWGYDWIQTLHSDHISQQHSWTQIPTTAKWKTPKDHLIYYWIQIILHECYRFYTILPFDASLCVTYAYIMMKTSISYIGTIICLGALCFSYDIINIEVLCPFNIIVVFTSHYTLWYFTIPMLGVQAWVGG